MSNDAASSGVEHRSVAESKLPFAFARKFGVVLVFDESGRNPQACAKGQLSLSTLAEIRRYTQQHAKVRLVTSCLLYTSPSPRDATLSRMPSSA